MSESIIESGGSSLLDDVRRRIGEIMTHAHDLRRAEDAEGALALARQAVEMARASGLRDAEAEGHDMVGALLYILGRLHEAEAEVATALDLFTSENDTESIISVRRTLGIINHDLANHDRALEHHLAALRLSETLGDKGWIARIYNNIGVVYHAMLRYDEALGYYELARGALAEVDIPGELGRVLGNIGTIHSRLGHYELALESHRSALEIKEALGDGRGLAITLGSIGNLHAIQGEFDQALEFYRRSLAMRDIRSDRRGVAIIHRNIASILNQFTRYDEALDHCQQAIELARDLDARDLLWQFHQEMSAIHENRGDYKSALEHHRAYTEYLNRTLDTERQRTIAELQTKYDLEKATSEREQFRRRMLEWEHKAFRAQVNPHFLFNALNSIQYFLVEHDTESAARYLSRFARLMRLALDNSRSTLIPLQSELECLELYLALESLRFGDRLAYDISVDEQTDPGELNVPPMILQPYVENAIWHGILPLSRPGHVRIRVRCDASDRLLCSIEDDGVGRGAGHDSGSERRHSSGMTMIEERLVLLEQTTGLPCHVRVIDLVDAEGRPLGTRVELDLPAGLLPGDP